MTGGNAMTDKTAIKKSLCDAVDSSAEEIRAFAKDIQEHPELGFRELHTSERLSEELEKLGLKVRRNIAVTGVRADIAGCADGPKISIIGELDGIVCRAHPSAEPLDGASHACGHNLQISSVLAAAAALAKTGAMKELAGSVCFMGTPAEEYIEITQRKRLRDEGKIVYLCGKPEFVRLGEFDDVDMAMMVHAGDDAPKACFGVPDGGNGFRVFMVRYKGRQAHAAAAPDQGVNALYAAVAGINAVNALRETFRDDDHVRVHFIITKGGDSVNSVPDDVRLEGYVRARTAECIDEIFAKVQKAFEAGGASIGAECFFSSIPGDMPLVPSKQLNQLFCDNAEILVGAENVARSTYFAASTDMGDITHLMPAIHPSAGGVVGHLHAANFEVVDFNAAVLAPAKAMLMTLVDLLADDAAEAKAILKDFKPVYTKEEYLASMDSRFFGE